MQGWIPYTQYENMNGFRVLLLELQNHRVLARKGKRCRLVLFNNEGFDDVISKVPYTTIIIGPNGVGKSFILAAIADIFRHIKKVQNDELTAKDDLGFRFAIQYFFNGHCYKVSTLTDSWAVDDTARSQFIRYNCWEDDKSCSLARCPVPCAVLASAVSINDRFKTQKKADGFYWYLGARNPNSPSTTGTRTLVRKTVSAIAECLTSGPGFKQKLIRLLDYLELETRMDIEYSFRYRKVYLAHRMTNDEFINIFDHWEEPFRQAGSRRKNAPWGHKKYPEIRDTPNNIDLIVNYINKIVDGERTTVRSRIRYSIGDPHFVEDWKAIDLLTQLDIMTYPTIRVYKKQGGVSQNYMFEESSSGETNMLCQFINIISHLEHHSLVLIDEPETSAHPDWQVRYIEWLNGIFESFTTCHFIISTHSHFLLTDLRKETSAVVALRKEDGEVVNISEGFDTFCWSVDDILYKVFKVRNTRNRAFENHIMRLYQLMKTDSVENKQEARRIIDSLKDVVLNDGDPLLYLLDKGRKYVES